MLIPSVFVTLPKTLLKWTTTPPHCKKATKFKAKYVKRQKQAAISTQATKATTETTTANSSSSIKIAATTTVIVATTAFKAKQYFSCQLNAKSLVTIVLLSASLSFYLTNASFLTLFTYVYAALPLSVSVVSVSLAASVLLSVCFYALVLILLLNAQFNQYIQQNFLSDAVITKLVVLMNDFRMKTLFKPTTTTITAKTIALIAEATKNLLKVIRTVLVGNKQTNKNFNNNYNNKNGNNKNNSNNSHNNNSELKHSTIFVRTIEEFAKLIVIFITPILPTSINCSNNNNNITVAALVTLRLFNNQTFSSNNHRTYNNSSKSNKVFLHYTPRDPRLRIFENFAKISFNKHHFDSLSELKITEDLCAYGELIGGLLILNQINTNTLQQQVLSVNYSYCDYNKINKRNNISEKNQTESVVKSVENNLIVSESLFGGNIYVEVSQKLKSNETQKHTADKVEKQQFSLVKFLRNLHFLETEHLKATIKTVCKLV